MMKFIPFLLLGAAVFAETPVLQFPEAPFAVRSGEARGEKPKPKLDAENLTFEFGSKRVIFTEAGNFTLMSGSHRIATYYFTFSTPFTVWAASNAPSVKRSAQYNGTPICITSCDADAAAGTLTVKGQMAYHEKEAGPEAYKVHTWSQTARLTSEGKLEIEMLADIPDITIPPGSAKARGAQFFNLGDMVREYKVSEPLKGRPGVNMPHRFPRIEFAAGNADDSFAVSVMRNSIIHHGSDNRSFYLTEMDSLGRKQLMVVDPGEYAAAASQQMIGGVDFKTGDDFVLPTTGKNLLPNPYFASGLRFVHSGVYFALPTDAMFPALSTDARFGRYSLPPGRYRFGSFPADPGTYTFSFYIKGKGHFNAGVGTQKAYTSLYSKQENFDTGGKWVRFQQTFTSTENGFLCPALRFEGAVVDGLQLEKGSAATEFAAPAVTANLITDPPDFFFESGKPVKMKLELSTLAPKVAGKAEAVIHNFFREEQFKHEFSFDFAAGEYPEITLPVEKAGLPDGIYTLEIRYRTDAGEVVEHFRFSIMPFLRNEHATARIFSTLYGGSWWGKVSDVSERYLARLRSIGVGAYGHTALLSAPVIDKYRKYGIMLFDGSCVSRDPAERYRVKFPELADKIMPGHVYFYVYDPEKLLQDPKSGVLADYRLLGGWSEDYKRKFQAAVREQIAKNPGKFAYCIGGEWPREIKDDPHYIDLVIAYFEAVKSVYPDALVYEAGAANMYIRDGVAEMDNILTRLAGRWQTELVATHPYLKHPSEFYPSLRAVQEVLKKHKLEKTPIAFAEFMHFYPYDIPAWNCEVASAQRWEIFSPFSYDLGWTERLSAAWYARCYLTAMIEFDRLYCVTSGSENTRNIFMDADMTPRASQKISNTLGILLGNPKRYLGDFSFGPDVRCFVWEDETGSPLAAVWLESKVVDSGAVKYPVANMNYPGAVYTDLMGVVRKPAKDGEFQLTPFPLFIRGRKGDFNAFTGALAATVIKGTEEPPFRISDELTSPETLTLSLINDLARPLNGSIRIDGHEQPLNLPAQQSRTIDLRLPQAVSDREISEIRIPMAYRVDGQEFKREFQTSALAVRKFKGDWSNIPKIRMDNLCISRDVREERGYPGDFQVDFQVAWQPECFRLRVTVEDDMLTAANSDLPGNRWNWDVCQVFFDTRCSARKTGKNAYDEDDYDYSLMPLRDGSGAEVWRAVSPFMQLTLGTAAPKDNVIATEIPAKFTRTKNGYIYEAEFPAPYMLPAQMRPNWNLGMGLYVADRDKGNGAKQGYSLSTQKGQGCWNRPLFWPLLILVDK